MEYNYPEPNSVFKFFYEISKIPHGSKNTKAISDYCVNVAKDAGLWCRQDEFNNVIIKKPASKGFENRPSVIIQGHLDMVCEKEDGNDFDFEKDALKLKVDGDFIHAQGTTLGGDDGIAVCYALALLTDNDIPTPELEVIFTTDEEIGMDGAIGLDMSDIKSKMLLNIDSESEGIFTVSCAGGVNAEITLDFDTEENEYNIMEVTFSELSGGHSGVEIDKGRANSNILIGKLLKKLTENQGVRFVAANGGSKSNAIASHASLTVAYVDGEAELIECVDDFEKEIKEKYSLTDPNMTVKVKTEKDKQVVAADEKATKEIAELLSSLPDGIYSMSEDIEGLVKTSSNFGIMKTFENSLYLLISIRSSDEEEKTKLLEEVTKIAQKSGAKVTSGGDYPAWEYKKESHLRDVMCRVFEIQYKKPPKTEAIHAGLECGIFSGKVKGLDCVSFGPDILDIHTPKERMSISSVQRVWEFLKEVLSEI